MCGYSIAGPNGGMTGGMAMVAMFMLTLVSVFMPKPVPMDGINGMDWMYGGPLENIGGLMGNPMDIICIKNLKISFTVKINYCIVN